MPAMLKINWSSLVDQMTPKASQHARKQDEVNPFDRLPPSPASPNEPRTPGASPFAPHQLLKGGPKSPVGSVGADGNMEGIQTEIVPLGGGGVALPSSPGAALAGFAAPLPTTSLSLHAPDFNMSLPPPKQKSDAKQPPAALTPQLSRPALARQATATPANPTPNVANAHASSSSSSTSGSPKGQIHVKVIAARSLNVTSLSARPYVVVVFENNEFVSRDPTFEDDKEVKGVPANLSRTSSSVAISALGKAQAQDAAARRKTSPSSSAGSSSAKSSFSHHTSSSTSTSTSTTNGTNGLLGGRMSAHNPVWKHEVSFDVTSEESTIAFNVYDRSQEDQPYLGTVQYKPILIHDHTVDQWFKLKPTEEEFVTGEIRIQITFEQSQSKRALTPRDFEFLKLIGRGTFGRVFQVRKKDTKRIYAMKVLSKKEIIAKKEVAHTIGERKILQRSLESPFLVGLKFSFQTDADLYLVTDFKSGGELFWHLQKETRFTEERARFYIAELVLALEHLHKYDIVYRDLKPENILLDATGHVALCDFGLSKPDLRSDELTNTFCGTTEYLAPEVLLDEHGYSKLVDFWSLGVLLFEMCCGWSPFYAEDTQQMYKNICFGKIRFPKGVINEDGKQFVKGLLNRNPRHRLGAQRDAAELKEHPFFKTIDWIALGKKQVTPPFKPNVESDESTANFDPEFTSADLDAGLTGVGGLDEDDPSEEWVSASVGGAVYTPQGPLGSDRPPHAQSQTPAQSINIGARKRHGPGGSGSPPLTSSVQENFRGFTYSGEGESVIAQAAAGRLTEEAEVAVDEADSLSPTTDDEAEDDEHPAGRYARRRGLNGLDDDFDAMQV